MSARQPRPGHPDQSEHHPTVICGDFNDTIHSSVYQLMAAGFVFWHPCIKSDRVDRDNLLSPQIGIDRLCRRIKGPVSKGVGPIDVSYPPEGVLAHRIPLMSVYYHAGHMYNEADYLNFERLVVGNPDMRNVQRHFDALVEFSTHHSRETQNVDYIFYTVAQRSFVNMGAPSVLAAPFGFRVENVVESSLRLIGRLSLPTISDIDNRRIGRLPNKYFGSDHLPLGAEFLFML